MTRMKEEVIDRIFIKGSGTTYCLHLLIAEEQIFCGSHVASHATKVMCDFVPSIHAQEPTDYCSSTSYRKTLVGLIATYYVCNPFCAFKTSGS